MMQAYFQILPKENLTDGSIPLYHKVIVDGESPVAICRPSLSLATFRYERVCQQQHFFGFKLLSAMCFGEVEGSFWLSQEGYGQRYQVFAGSCPCFF